MAETSERSFPFDAEEIEDVFDRAYPADEFAEYFRAFITSGVFMRESSNLQVIANGDMSITIKPGRCIIDGYRYTNNADIVRTLEPADGVTNRIDRVSATWDKASRDIHVTVQTGEYKYKPVAPQCRRDAEYKDYVLADIYIEAGAIAVKQANITDQRLNGDVCGLATPFMELDTTTLYLQLEAFYADFVKSTEDWTDERKAAFDNWYKQMQDLLQSKATELDEWIAAEKKDMEEWTTTEQAAFEAWFDHIKEELTDDAVGHLQAQIDNDVFKSYREELQDINTAPSNLKSGCYGTPNGDKTATSLLVTMNRGQGSASGMQLLTNYKGDSLRVRSIVDNNRYSPWRPLAFADDVVKQIDFETFRITEMYQMSNPFIRMSTLKAIDTDGKTALTETLEDVFLADDGDVIVLGTKGVWFQPKQDQFFVPIRVPASQDEDAVLTCGYVPYDIISWPFGEDKGAVIAFTSHGVYKLSKNIAENPGNYSMTFLYDYPVSDYYGTSYRAIAQKNYVITYGENLSYIAIKKNGSGFDGFEKISISTIGSSASVGKIVAYDEEQSMILLSDKKIAMVDGEGNLEMTSMVFPVNPSKHCNFIQTSGVFFATSGRDIYRSADKGITWEKYDPYTGKSSLYSSYDTRGAFPVLQNVGNIIVGLLKENNDTCHIIATKDGSTWEEVGKKIELNTSLAICSWKIYRDRLFLQPYQGSLYEMSALLGQADIKDQVTNIADRVCKIESKTDGGTDAQIVTIGSVTAAASLDISGKAKKITLLVKKVTATATTGAAIYQYINLPTTEDGVTAPKLSALTAAISTSHGTIAVSGEDILLKSVKGFSITAVIDYKNY